MFTFRFTPVLCVIVSLVASSAAFGDEELSALDIMLRNEKMSKSINEIADMKMVLTNNSGKERTRIVHWVADDTDPVNRKSLIRFVSPRDIKDTGLLTVEKSDIDDDRWLYLPALRKIRRISASDKTDSFMGTDFSFEDFETPDGVQGSQYREYKILGEEEKNGAPCYVIEAVTTDPEELEVSGYSKRHVWIRKDNFMRTFEVFYDKDGEMVKTLDSQDIHPVSGADKQLRAHRIEMTTLNTGHKTTMYFSNVRVDQELADNTFSRVYLQRGI